MNILVIGSGGREHSLAWKISQSALVDKLYVAPGNGGMDDVATCVNMNISDHDEIIRFCRTNTIEFVVVGPENPLVDGLVDRLIEEKIAAFGPTVKAAILEGSKGFTKDLCAKYNIPTAAYGRFKDAKNAKEFISKQSIPVVIKADGLAAGKGVIIAQSLKEAYEAVDDIFSGQFGEAGNELVVEEFLTGEEASFFVLTDGYNILPFGTAQDHKRVGEGDTGPNTGGMGAYSPAAIMDDQMIKRTIDEIILPTVHGMRSEGRPFQGVLFAGLMITQKGPELIEYNVRFGDPECQTLMMRLKSDIVPALMACSTGDIDKMAIQWSDDMALNVVMATKGYPGKYQKNSEIRNIKEAESPENIMIFHAGTEKKQDKIYATGGRVLNVTAISADIITAKENAYAALDKIDWPEGFCRRDIGWRAAERCIK
jgi:phosphoribosylamine---glycine ligase